MSLLIKEKDVFSVTIHFKLDENGKVEVLEKEEIGCETETFVFKHPAWKDVRSIIEQSHIMINGASVLDPIAFIEAKVKTLLKSWSLKDSDDKAIPISKIDLIPAKVMFHVGIKMDDHIGNLIGIVQEQKLPKDQQG